MASLGKIRDGVPATGEAPVADYICALALAFGVSAALLRRERTGRGGDLEVALFMAALLAQNNSLVRVTRVDGPVQAEALARLKEMRAAGASFEEQGASIPSARTAGMLNVYFRTYPTKDDVIGIACVSPALQRTLMETLGLTDEAYGGAIKDRDALERHYAALGTRVEALLASRTSAEWKQIFDKRGLPGASVRFAMEMFEDEQTLANGFLYDLPHPALGPVRVLAPPVKLDGDGFQPGAATPPFGSETRAILKDVGFSEGDIDTLVAAKVTRTGL
jgi:crotonobetainyl-CoA:carnitine CoA-transferase CaiB-like acyl-CoA transferase